jgi:hypothetical protein
MNNAVLEKIEETPGVLILELEGGFWLDCIFDLEP